MFVRGALLVVDTEELMTESLDRKHSVYIRFPEVVTPHPIQLVYSWYEHYIEQFIEYTFAQNNHQ